MALPERTLDTMSDSIALGSPNGSMSKRSKDAAMKRLGAALFGDYKPTPRVSTNVERATILCNQAADLRRMADAGMKPRSFRKQANAYEAEAALLLA